MKKLIGLMVVLFFLQSLMVLCNISPLLADDVSKISSESASIEKVVQDIQAKCKAIDAAKSYRKVETSPSAAAKEGNASDVLEGYYDGNALKKISTHAFGEKGVGVTEYYFDHDKLIFVSWHTPSYEGKQPKEDFGQFYFKDGKLIQWIDAGGKVADEGLVKTKDLYARREISVKGWADEARKRIEGHVKE